MDLAVHLRVLFGHKVLLAAGLGAAIMLAFLSFVSVGPGGIAYRQSEQWQSITRLSAARGGNPFKPAGSNNNGSFVDPTTFAVIAAQFANSPPVRRLIRRDGSLQGEVSASPAVTDTGAFLPFVDVSAIAVSPAAAQSLAARSAEAIARFVQRQQVDSGVPAKRQIILRVVTRPDKPALVKGRKKGTPMFIFLGHCLPHDRRDLHPGERSAIYPGLPGECPRGPRRTRDA